MLRLTIVGRVSDGLGLAQGPIQVDEENFVNISVHKQQAEFLLKEISRGALSSSRMTIFLDHLCFNYTVENGICFMALCDSTYPRKLVFHYLQDLQVEFKKIDTRLIERITRPYSFVKFDRIIGNVRKKYVDTRTQANLLKINSDGSPEMDIVSQRFSEIVKRRRRFEMFERMSEAHLHASPIWCSERLEIIALKWIPLGLLVLSVTFVLVWTGLRRNYE